MALETRTDAGLSWKYLPVKLTHESVERDFLTHILPIVRPTWNGRDVRNKIFTDGLTNTLHGFCLESNKDDMVLLRMNGDGTENFLNRKKEIVLMVSLHRAGINPPVFMELANGLCYGYIPGRPFTVDDMQVYTLL